MGHTTTTRGKQFDHLGVALDFTRRKILKIDIAKNINQIKKDFPRELRKEKKP